MFAYDNVSGILTFTAPNPGIEVNDFVTLRDLNFSVGVSTTLIPDGTLGYDFKVISGSEIRSQLM